MSPLILITDDDPGIRQILAMQLQDAGYRTIEAAHGAEAMKCFLEQQPDLLLTDLRMPYQDGHTLLEQVRQHDPGATVIVMTAYATVETAVEVMKAGAFDFIVKPFRESQVLAAVERALQVATLKGENRRLRRALAEQPPATPGSAAPAVQAVYAQGMAVADTDATVLIHGETGTGKEHLATALHRHSRRAGGPWVVVNCGALPENLVEAELFGHTRGAFTGAHGARAGRIAAADGGTLFLDEIGDLPLGAQVKLLRFLQEGEIQAVGADAPVKVDVRIIAATHRDLSAMLAEGSFREDLYYRLSVIQLYMPPLRERREDIAPLALNFLAAAAQRHAREPVRPQRDALLLLENAGWPGNVRQLKNLCERWTLLHAGRELSAELLSPDLSPPRPAPAQPWQLPPEGVNLAELEKQLIRQALARSGGHKSRAARLLGISRHTLDYRMEKHGLTGPAGLPGGEG